MHSRLLHSARATAARPRGLALLAALFSLLLLGIALRPAPAQAAFSGPGGKIAFTTTRTGNDDIWIMDADGSNQAALTTDAASDRWPIWSPDGTQIAFHSDRDGDFDIWVMDADGSNQTNLTNDPASNDSVAAWSPDGSRIAFRSDRSGNPDIWIMDADGSNPTQLTTDLGEDYAPDWSPDGTKIIFFSFRLGHAEIYSIEPDGSNETRLTYSPPGRDASNGAFSPDGSQIVYTAGNINLPYNANIFVMNADGSQPKPLTNYAIPDDAYVPQWSPDGRKIYYALTTPLGDLDDVWSINADGSGNPTNLTNDPGAFDYLADQQPVVGKLTIEKQTEPAGGTGFPFAILNGPVSYSREFGSDGSGEGQMRFPNYVAHDTAAGRTYVTDGFNRVQVFDNNGNFVEIWGWGVSTGAAAFEICTIGCQSGLVGSGNGQFSNPTGITVDSLGNVYVADIGNYRIQKFTGAGAYVTQWGSFGFGNGEFGQIIGGLAVDATDNIYIADTDNHRVQKFTSGGAFQAAFGTLGSNNGEFQFPYDVAVRSDNGDIYVADSGNNRIQRLDSGGVYQAQWGSQGSANGQFEFPVGITLDSSFNVYVADAGNNRVQKFNSAGAYQSTIGSSGNGNGQFFGPQGLAVSNSGSSLLVVDSGNNRVQEFTVNTQTYVRQFGSQTYLPGNFILPYDAATDSAGNLYVADTGNNRFQKFAADGSLVCVSGGFGTGAGQFNQPQAIAVDETGVVYVADSGNSRIQKFDANTCAFVQMWGWGVDNGANALQTCTTTCEAGIPGSGDGQFDNVGLGIRGVDVDSQGNVFVVDTDNYRVQKFSSAGAFLTKWGTQGAGNTQFDQPWGVAVNSQDEVFVSDPFTNNRVQKFDNNGGYLATVGGPGTAEGQFTRPFGIEVDKYDNLYVADRGNFRMQKFDTAGNFLIAWGYGVDDGLNVFQNCTGGCQAGTAGSRSGQFLSAYSVAVGGPDTIYVVDGINDRIQVFKQPATMLDDDGTAGYLLAPDTYTIAEMVPDGWTLTDISCDSPDKKGFNRNGDSTTGILSAGDDVTCIFTNTAEVQPPSAFCPVDDPGVGTLRTDVYGTGKLGRVAKVNVPNYLALDSLYGQLAAVDTGIMKWVRFSPKGGTLIQLDFPTSPAVVPATVQWWGTDLDLAPQVKGAFFWGKKGNRAPRAFVLWPTYDTGGTRVANAFDTFDSPANYAYFVSTPIAVQTLSIPETQANGADITVNVALVDVNKDNRSVILTVEAGGVSESRVITVPNRKQDLNLETFVLEGVPGMTDEVTITLESPVVGAGFPYGGDSAAMIGASANYACEVPVR